VPDPVKPSIDVSAAYVCDFCSDPDPRWCFPAAAFTQEAYAWGSCDDWAACDDCHRLIVLERYERLLKRSARAYLRRNGSLTPHVLEALSRLHESFRAHRMGPPIEIDPGEVIA
jgi:hypothetical protein